MLNMKPIYSEIEFNIATTSTYLPCKCYHCDKIFYMQKKDIIFELNNNRGRIKFCTFKCSREFLKKRKMVTCANCSTTIEKKLLEIKKSKNNNNFCSRSCAATYNNTHKTKGNRRSKLEAYLEKELTKTYPHLEIHFNRKDTINSELDIYIPSLKLAFELNSIFH